MSSIIEEINKYYSHKILSFGATPKGVDWNGIESQNSRFEQLLIVANKEIGDLQSFSILDFGCGFGALLTHLKSLNIKCDYLGYDISVEMLKHAKNIFSNEAEWINELNPSLRVDYVVASGIFNVKLEQSTADWENYILNTLDKINNIATKGFSFNILTSYSNVEYLKSHLYYASPEFYFSHCKINYSKNVSLLHDYDLYEFTLIIRK